MKAHHKGGKILAYTRKMNNKMNMKEMEACGWYQRLHEQTTYRKRNPHPGLIIATHHYLEPDPLTM